MQQAADEVEREDADKDQRRRKGEDCAVVDALGHNLFPALSRKPGAISLSSWAYAAQHPSPPIYENWRAKVSACFADREF